MAVQYGSFNVDERYKASLLPNLFYKTWIMPGITCQDVQSDNNGGWFWHKLATTAIDGPGTPGRDFTDEATADTLVQAVYNNNYQKSKKIYGVQAAAVAFNVAEAQLAIATQEVAESKNMSGLACLIKEGTAAANTDDVTADNFQTVVLAVRKEVVKAKATATTVLCSPDFFAAMLEFAGSKYIPSTNEKILAAAAGGQVGEYLGMLWIECNALSTTGDVKYYDYAGTLQTVANVDLAKVDFIMYDYNAFGTGDNLTAARIVDSENFVGSKAQVEDNVAFRVLNPTAVRVKSHA